ncbi:MAG: lysylphosphatidylglycerol synthase transmembrane domain-containing protein [Vicinamibacterales bacterium]
MSRRNALLALQATVTVALLAFLLRGFEWQALRAIGERLSVAFYVAAFAVIATGQLLYAWRWQTVLSGMGVAVPYADVLKQYMIGLFFSNLMPSAVGGDAVKVYYLGRHIGYMEAGASVVVDRFLGFFWLSVLGAGLSWTAGDSTPLLVLNRNLLSMAAAAFTIALMILRVVPPDRIMPQSLRRRGLTWVARIETLAGHVRAAGLHPRTLAVSGAVTVCYIALVAVAYRAFFTAAGVTAPGILPTMNVLVSTAVFVNVPISVGGIGLREQLHYLLFAELGVAKEASVSISLVMFACSLALSLAGYVIWLRIKPAIPAVAA